MYNLPQLKQISVRDLALKLGLEVRGNTTNARCFNQEAHTSGDKNPSLGLDNQTNRFKCFACDIGGTTIDLVMKTQNLDFKEACRWLSQAYGIVQQGGYTPKLRSDFKKVGYQPIPNANKPATAQDKAIYNRFYQLCDTLSLDHLTFLGAKGFSKKVLDYFGWKTITDEAIAQIQKEFSTQELEASGLFSGSKFKFYYHRLLVPYMQEGRADFIRGRSVDPNAQAKYINPVGKTVPVFNYNALMYLKPNQPLFICEGETDTMTLTDEARLAVGIAGATQDQTIKDFVDFLVDGFGQDLKIILAFDNDPAGKEATRKTAEAFLRRGVLVKVYNLPPQYKDITEYFNSGVRKPIDWRNELGFETSEAVPLNELFAYPQGVYG